MNLKAQLVIMEIILIRSSVQTDYTGFDVITISDATTDGTFPSIPATTLKIPLPFFFSGKSGLALPLIALQYHGNNRFHISATL